MLSAVKIFRHSMESKSTVAEGSTSSEVRKLPSVVVREEVHTLIGSDKNMGLITTYEEVLEGLRKYILKKKLFDELNPYKVCCKNDELGSILGIEEFTVSDLKYLMQKIVIPVNKTHKNSVIKDPPVIKPAEAAELHSDNPLKRKLDESVESDKKKVVSADGKLNTSPIVIRIPPSPKYVEESDSVESVQGYETALVKDTSDDVLSSDNEHILAVEETFNIEYEVDSDSSVDCDSSDSEVGEDPETMMLLDAAIMAFLSKPESDIEFFADDSSENDSDDDVEISESDFWVCKTCKVANKPPMRYCLRCFNERLNWLPDRERKRKPRKSHAKDKGSNETLRSSQPSSQESTSSTVSCKIKETPSDLPSEYGSASTNVSSPSVESLSSSCMTSTDLPCSESSDMPSSVRVCSPFVDTEGLQSINYLGSPHVESVTSPYFKPVGPYIVDPTDSGLHSIGPNTSFCMQSMGAYFDRFSNWQSPENSLQPSSLESSSVTSLDSLYPSSAKSSDFSSSEFSGPSSMKSLDSTGRENVYSSNMKSSSSSDLQISSSTNSQPGQKLCMICCSKPALASIIHGKYAHQITCYECARKIRKQRGDCPVCRRPIEKVVHQITD